MRKFNSSNSNLLVFQNQKRHQRAAERVLKNRPLTEQLSSNPPKYFDGSQKTTPKKNRKKKYKEAIKRQKQKEIQEMILKNKMYPQKYQNTYFITDKEQIGLLYEGPKGTAKSKKGRNHERLLNIARAGNLEDPEKLKRFLEEDQRINQQKKRKYLSNAKKKQKVGSKMNSIHLKFFKKGANKRGIMPKVHDNRIKMLGQNEQDRMEQSARKLENLRKDLRTQQRSSDLDISEANRFYLSNA